VEFEFSRGNISLKHVDQEQCHALGLHARPSPMVFEVTGKLRESFWIFPGCVLRDEIAVPAEVRIYNPLGMSKLMP
jgi:hypothetical protein